MSYCDQSDLNDEFGQNNVIAWSNKDNVAAAVDAEAVAKAITRAGATIDDKFRDSRYRVPLTSTSGATGGIPTTVRAWATVLAGYHLYAARGLRDDDEDGNKLTDRRDEVMHEINMTLAGCRRLAANLSTISSAPSAPTVAP